MVQKGKLALCAFALDKQLNKVDLPTFGNPTIPAFMNNVQFYKSQIYISLLIESILLIQS